MEELLAGSQQYVTEEALILIPALLILGVFLKKAGFVPDEYIPFILLVIGIALSIATFGVKTEAFVQGILVTGGAVLGNQAYKQVKKTSKK